MQVLTQNQIDEIIIEHFRRLGKNVEIVEANYKIVTDPILSAPIRVEDGLKIILRDI